jgi:HlyD family secretion protein
VIVRIDSTDIQQKLQDAQLDLEQAQSDFSAATENKSIQESSNAANLESAQVTLKVAKLDLEQYNEGDYPSNLEKAQTAVAMAQTILNNKQDDLAQTKSLFGKGFVTASDEKAAELAVLQARGDLSGKESDLTVLKKYQHEKDLATKNSALTQAKNQLVRVQRENASNMAQKEAALSSNQQRLLLRKQRLEHYQEQLAACTIHAPSDGMIVYGSSGPNSRRDTPIQPGATVRQQELLISLPDTTAMKAVCKINETLVTRLRVDPKHPMRATISVPGQTDEFTGWVSNISVLADNSERWWNPDSKQYPVDITLDHTPHGLKPGMSANVRIFVNRLKNVLTVPLSAVYAAGPDSYVFVRDEHSVHPVKIAIGDVNETDAQILDGLNPGQQVMLLQAGQGRQLLANAGIKAQPPSGYDNLFADSGSAARRGAGQGSGEHHHGRHEAHAATTAPTTEPAGSTAEAKAE